MGKSGPISAKHPFIYFPSACLAPSWTPPPSRWPLPTSTATSKNVCVFLRIHSIFGLVSAHLHMLPRWHYTLSISQEAQGILNRESTAFPGCCLWTALEGFSIWVATGSPAGGAWDVLSSARCPVSSLFSIPLSFTLFRHSLALRTSLHPAVNVQGTA